MTPPKHPQALKPLVLSPPVRLHADSMDSLPGIKVTRVASITLHSKDIRPHDTAAQLPCIPPAHSQKVIAANPNGYLPDDANTMSMKCLFGAES